jgi:hypothetical protein
MDVANPTEEFHFTPEQVRLLNNQQGKPLQVPVAETSKVYLVVEQGVISTLDEEYIREGLAHAAKQVSDGQEADWDVNEIKAAGRELLAQRKPSS